MGRGRRLPRSFYRRDPLTVAPELLGKVLVRGDLRARIVEVEAYRGSDDPASHAFRGPTPRTTSMFGDGGRCYVYFSYGMHWCANVVCGRAGEGSAVLLRAAVPLRGIETMRARRPAARRDRDLCRGPARLCQAFAIAGADDGLDLVTAERDLTLLDDGVAPPVDPGRSGRIGVSSGADRPWRWFVAGDPHCSRPV